MATSKHNCKQKFDIKNSAVLFLCFPVWACREVFLNKKCFQRNFLGLKREATELVTHTTIIR